MKQAIEWFAKNRVAANLLMLFILVAGALTVQSIKKEIFPETSSDKLSISVLYPGATPEEAEEAICIRIEEAIQDLEGIKQMISTAAENVGTVTVEIKLGEDAREVLGEVKARVDAIDTFPAEAEKPIVKELQLRRQVLNVAISGNSDEASLKRLGERVREELLTLPEISQVELNNVRLYEISIEVSEKSLRRYSLTFDEIVNAVRRSSLDLPAGSVKTSGGEILLRTKGQAYHGNEFENIILRTSTNGERLLLSHVAEVIDGFEETDQMSRFDGEPSALVQVFRVGDESALEVADAVKAYIAKAQLRMPEGIQLTTWQDDSKLLRSRLDLMLRNGRAGFILVFIALALFLKLHLAGWVALGIPISFLGAIWLMPGLDVSINMLSLFAFIVVLGIVVDDAIVVGENIYSHYQQGKSKLQAALDGVQEVAVPVIFAVLTTVAAFSPLLTVPGNMGKFMKVIPIIVISTLLFSLIESLFILPAHLSHLTHKSTPRARNKIFGYWEQFQQNFSDRFQNFIKNIYRPVLEFSLRWRYLSLSISIATLLLTIGLIGGGWIKFVFFPNVEADNVVAFLTMPQGTPVEVTARAIHKFEDGIKALRKEIDESSGEKNKGVFEHVLTSIGEQPFRTTQSQGGGGIGQSFTSSNLGEVNIQLSPSEERDITSSEIARRWRELTGAIPDAVELSFTTSLFDPGEAINFQLSGSHYEELTLVAEKVKTRLKDYPGVFDITDSFRAGKKEIKLSVKPSAETLGLTLSDVARQVRQAFYGEEAQRIQRGRDDVKVMVRYPQEERRSLADLENMRIRIADGSEVPFSVAAHAEPGRGYASIQRTDRRRTVNIKADVDLTKANANEVLADLTSSYLPQLLVDYPSITYSLEGEQKQQAETLDGLKSGFFLALLLIYALLAIPFRSYAQPLIVMSAIPFGLVGAVWGHIIMGMELTILSMFGLVALTGVVVNDSLVMVDFINRARAKGLSIMQALREAGVARFRPIILTSLTTFVGLTPLLLERSLQAQFLIPMAVSLAFGVVFATIITLILIPVGYYILEDIKQLSGKILRRGKLMLHTARR